MPKFEPLDADPATMERFQAWSRARDEFQLRMQTNPPRTPAERWQKHYYLGIDASGKSLAKDHLTKLHFCLLYTSGHPDAIEKIPERCIIERNTIPGAAGLAFDDMQIGQAEWAEDFGNMIEECLRLAVV